MPVVIPKSLQPESTSVRQQSDISLPAPLPSGRLLRAIEVQKELRVSRATAYRLMTDGTLPVYRFGGRRGQRAMVRVAEADLQRWLEEHKRYASSAV
ncbi:MAG: helix-turn-helix domain-containing protein [Bryobacteraceae bacterium]|nr:helix-turn-helix domain-containing protein [Bryobacteraceae bacterium]